MPQHAGRVLRFLAGVGVAIAASTRVVSAIPQVATAECREPQACRELALEAREHGAYEAFHDLAWRAVQTGRPNDPDLMYLLARAQALSGRRRDALIMLRRLAEAGIVTDAATDEDFRRVRELPEWRSVESLSNRARPAAAVPAPETAVAKPGAAITAPAQRAAPIATPPTSAAALPVAATAKPAPTVTRSAPPVEPASVAEAARFSSRPFVASGFAYDAVSRRWLFGDAAGRRVFLVGEGSARTVDLIRADSAGFDDVTGIAIDVKRGDLWVASTAANDTGAAIHRLQLISGRALARLPFQGSGPAHLQDLAVTDDGTVLILDSATPRILVRRPGAEVVDVLMPLMTLHPVSIAVSNDGRLAYVAHREGITRIDLASRRATPLDAGTDVTLAGFEFIRWHRDALVGSQAHADESRSVVRLQLNRDRRTITMATLIEAPAASEDTPTMATISGDDLYYLVVPAQNPGAGSGLVDVRVRRLTLK
jgi:hypothetical protein